MLTLIVLSAASVNAQVTIGSDKVPHVGAVLDLQSDNLGLKLPNVALDNDLTVFGLPVTSESTAAGAKGMYVYNTNPTVGEGVYAWDGYQWLLIKKSIGEKRVESIAMSDATPLWVLLDQNMQIVLDITPSDATESIEWSVDRGTGNATITQDGIFSGRTPGYVNVTAKTISGASVTKPFAILPPNTAPVNAHIGSKDYLTCDFNGDTWMIQNSEEGTAIAQYYDANPALARGFYYTRAQSMSVTPEDTPCPAGWHLPTYDEGTNLLNFCNNTTAGVILWRLMSDDTRRGGRANDNGSFDRLDNDGYIWITPTAEDPNASIRLLSHTQTFFNANRVYASVRCVKNK
ncbi:hypothetical protein FACS189421_11970 [Bacteroidia bacterium]|nr:hypothetical protein FACS189421_11970 [Bacteroidia bacterium]GHT04887.1 hypothetical protein FACS189423_08240 [Bacteroidia bacterium]